MDRNQQKRSSHSREKPGKMDPARGEVYKQSKRRSSSRSSVPTEKNSFAFELKESSSEEVNKQPMKLLLAEEMSKEMETRQRSPNVIAKLMGLDAMPTQQVVHKQHKKVSNSCSQGMESIRFQEKCASNGGGSFHKNRLEQPQFKDVFEVMESSKAQQHSNGLVQKERWTSELIDAKMDFIRMKFMEAKRLSTNDNLRQSKEFHDTLEALNSNKDLLLKFLQEPDSLFNKHLHNLHVLPNPSRLSYTRTLKSSNVSNYKSNDTLCNSRGKTEGNVQIQKGLGSSLRKHEKNHAIHNGHPVSLDDRSLKSPCEGKTETCHLPTRIVVLKPNLWKHEKKQGAISSPKSLASSHSRLRELRSENRESVTESRDRMKLVNNAEFSRSSKSRKIARDITQSMRQNASSGSANASASVLKGYAGDESSCSMSGKDSTNESEASSPNSGNSYDKNNVFRTSSLFSFQSPVSREAKKHLSERLKTTRTCQQVGMINKGACTLEEMLALSDKETEQMILDSLPGQSYSGDGLTRSDSVKRWGHPLGISSKDGWMVAPSRNLTRSRSLPASSSIDRRPKISIRHEKRIKDDSFLLEENINLGLGSVVVEDSFNNTEKPSPKNKKFSSKRAGSFLHEDLENNTIREIYESPNEPRKLKDQDKSKRHHIVSKTCVGGINDTRQFADGIAVYESENVICPLKIQEEQPPEPTDCFTLVKDCAAINQTDLTIEETPRSDPLVVSRCSVTEPDSPQSTQELQQPSPVSVLEPQFEEVYSSECFESISADLQGLRMQLQLLKLKSTETFTEGSEPTILSDDNTGEESDGQVEKKGDLAGMFRGDDRNYSYLVDLLSELGFHDADCEGLKGRLYSLDFLVDQGVFENLENKYGRLMAWPRSERRLLFDQINSRLAEILGPGLDQHPWMKLKGRRAGAAWDSESLLEEMWQFLVRCGREESRDMGDVFLGLEVRWLDMGDEVDAIGKSIEKLMINELIEEFVQELSFSRQM